MKLNILLAKTDALATSFKNAISDYDRFFSKSQGAFLGERRTYIAKPDTIDEPNKRGSVFVQTTVSTKLDWFIKANAQYIAALFSQEKTNSSGIATADLTVDGKSWGTFSSLELLRLKGMLENQSVSNLLSVIPVRSDSEEWAESDDEIYDGEGIFESPIIRGTNITTVKEDYILKDPNVSETSPNYNAVVAQRTTTMELGEYSYQKFSGQWSQKERADSLRRKHLLLVAVVEALKTCNEVEAVESALTSEKIFGHIFGR